MVGGTLATVLAIASTVASAGAQIYQSRQQAGEAKTQARVARRNADIERQNARVAAEETHAAMEAHRRKFERFRAAQIASAVAQGLDPTSVADVLHDSALEAKTDRAAILYRGGSEVTARLNSARMQGFQGSLFNRAARQSITSGYISAGTTLASGAYSYYSNKPPGSTQASPAKGYTGNSY